eukprot:TRINITY_DN23865_c0_g1_i1.p2 TRINITY_DN23865_c0_g1~~TRINITY_DN23865_c0_g1_i1.p2  ORF type:complete len:111 (-),score=1.22 TRINITY_DN23865_c0_g1_i1:343-630(-)
MAMYGAINIPWVQVLAYTSASSFTLLYILINFNDSLEKYLWTTSQNGLVMFARELCTVLGIYFLMFAQLLWCWMNWGVVSAAWSFGLYLQCCALQ